MRKRVSTVIDRQRELNVVDQAWSDLVCHSEENLKEAFEKAAAAHSQGSLVLSNKRDFIPKTDTHDGDPGAWKHDDDEPTDVALYCDDEECDDVTDSPKDTVVHIDEPPTIK